MKSFISSLKYNSTFKKTTFAIRLLKFDDYLLAFVLMQKVIEIK